MNIFSAFAFAAAMAVCTAAPAQQLRRVIDPASSPAAKAIVQVAQLDGIANGEGNGFVIGGQGCHVLTNFHVAYGKGKAASGHTILVENQELGHVVGVGVDLDPQSGVFKRKVKGRVVEFGNFEEGSTQGMRGDIALLKLDTCLGGQYGVLKIERPAPNRWIPDSALTTLSFSRTSDTTWQLFAERACAAAHITPIAGLFVSTCETFGGMSGSPLLKEDRGQYVVVGMHTGKLTLNNGPTVPYALSSETITKFLDGAMRDNAELAGLIPPPP